MTTCVFDSGHNEGGYGGPNPYPDGFSLTASKIELYAPGQSVPYEYNPYPFLPNVNGDGISITIADLGVDSFDIGVWKFVYTVTASDGTEYVSTCYGFNTCEVNCCIDSKTKSVDPLCDPDKFDQIADLERLLKAAESAFCQREYDKADSIIKYVNEQCNCCC